MLGLSEELRTHKNAKSLFLLINHKQVTLHGTQIKSEYSVLMKGDVNKIRLPYFVIFIANNKEAREKFFQEEMI